MLVLIVGWFGARAASPTKPADAVARLALISDLHIRQATNDSQVRAHQRLHQAIADVNASKVDLVLVAGDLTEHGRPDELRAFRDHMVAFDAPVWYVPGNHDVGNKIIPNKTEKGPVSAWRVRFYESLLGPSFFARTHAGVRVIGINSPLIGTGFPQETKMWALLERELGAPTRLPTIAMIHFPPFSKTADEPGGEYWNLEPDPRRRLIELLKKAGVKTVLSGHLHRELINRHDGILFLTTQPVSFGLSNAKQREGWMLITVPREGPARFEFRKLAPDPRP
jgi:3',5'-cyclic AMP phosphodiesterase CpdA